MFCCTLLYVHSSIAIILVWKREMVVLLNLSSWCLLMVERLFLAVPWGCLRFVIVIFPDHTHLLFLVCKTNCPLPAVSNFCMVLSCIFPTTICNSRWHLFVVVDMLLLICLTTRIGNVVPTKSDSDVIFCLQSYQVLMIDR